MGKGVVEASVPRDSVTVALPQIVDEAVPDVRDEFPTLHFLVTDAGEKGTKGELRSFTNTLFQYCGGGRRGLLRAALPALLVPVVLVGAIVFCVGRSSCSCWFLDLSRIGGP